MARWQHQVEAFEYAKDRKATLLDAAMGTGKSKVAVDLVNHWGAESTLILCPTSVRGVWRRELEKWGGPKPLVLEKGTTTKKAGQLVRSDAAVVVVNYESAWRGKLSGELLCRQWGVVICDESHRIKSHNAKASRWAAKLQADHKLALTGTVMPSSPLDVFGQCRFLDPKVFGLSWHRFKNVYARLVRIPGVPVPVIDGYRNLDDLQKKLLTLTHRITSDVLDLPDKQTITIEVDLEPPAARIYRELEHDLIADIGEGVVTAGNALVRLLRLSQVTSGVVPVDGSDERRVVSTAKQGALRDIVAGLPPGESVVVFGRFKSDLAAAQRVAEECDREYCEISGTRRDLTSHATMLDSPGQVLGVNIQSGGVGIDLTQARYCVFFSVGYSLGDFEQAVARVHRPGQTRPVVYYHLLCQGTVDQSIMQSLESKREIIGGVLECLKK